MNCRGCSGFFPLFRPCLQAARDRGSFSGSQVIESGDEFAVVAFRFNASCGEMIQDRLDQINRGKDESDGPRSDIELSLSCLIKDILCGMRYLFQAGKTDEAACSLNGMDSAKNTV